MTDAIEQFWQWWATVAAAFDAGIKNRGISEEMVQAMSEHVAAIDPSLDWELGPGRQARHHLCVSAKGDPRLRVVAERWAHRAPTADATWEFYPARQPSSLELVLEIAGHKLALQEFRYAVELDEGRELLDVEGYHPAFESIQDEDLRQRVLFIALDNALGEDGVERWLGGIEATAETPEESVSATEFVQRVEELAGEATGEQWVLLRGSIEDTPIFVMTNLAIKRVDHLLLDQHVIITVRLRHPTEEGLPTDDEANMLNGLEDELLARLADHAVQVARETHAGKRMLHLHVMEGGPAPGVIDAWRQAHPDYEMSVAVSADPDWEVLQRWT